MVKIGIVYDNFLSPYFAGGGSVHAFEVTVRLKKYFDIVYIPSSKSLRWPKEALEKKVKEIKDLGIDIADEFYDILDKYGKFRNAKIKDYVRIFNVKDIDILYEPDHTSFDIFYFGKKFGITFHVPPFYTNSLRYLSRLIKFYKFNPSTGKGFYTRFLYNELIAKPKHRSLLRKYPPTFIAAVSSSSLVESGLNGKILKPGNAFDPSLLKYRGRGKEDYVVFWSRLNQDKGFPELPDILKIINKEVKTKLVVMGKFFDNYNKNLFFKKVKKYGINVDYLGFVPKEKLYDIASKAKVLIYPSHVDGFSLVVLEALALGIPVVAYDIPAISSVYGDLNQVKIVKEFDKESMAKEAIKIIKMSDKEIEDLMNNDEKLLKFLELHSSWDNVAEAVKNVILTGVNT
ncbi:glycosyltransferase family 1 protein [Sulfolobus sp. S-194]|uniref:glycosyltransferase family 4 protein n=1 Tax=Sulfolobus sp. S-194 TaxID=2512240 RepID=UPI0014370B22|nr:glycosyltransferase [Sulfolobus sp. S-194]QIW23735.1 glycosyltransferase family 1 protein [Sulfolobus sp. S-194]